MSLSKIIGDVQTVCEAIASVVHIDVTIVDDDLIRIAGTGRYRDTIGRKVSTRSAFHYALDHDLAFTIENPGEHQACLDCECKDKCLEHAEMCCPIVTEDGVKGVIGLIAFMPDQRHKLIENQADLMRFLSKMAELIASKLKEQAAREAMGLLASELKVAMDAMESAFVISDAHGVITRKNQRFEKLFKGIEGKHLNEFVETEDILASVKPMRNKRLTFPNGCKGIYDVAPVRSEGGIGGYVLTITPLETVLQTVNAMTQDGILTTFDAIIGSSEALNRVKEMAYKVALQGSTVLIDGESGTGKELFARAIHSASKRANAPFVTVNCAAIPDTLLESELFGYEEGAFTGARRGGKAGKFQLADGGTLFLDEIGDMPLHLQAKLLRVLQEQVIDPIGGIHPIKIDVRVIAATHQNLEEKVLEGAFRQDLYYRLNVIPLSVPPLRARTTDIEVLVRHFIRVCNAKLEKSVTDVHPACLDKFKHYPWPGNVRELMNVVEYAVNMCEGDEMYCTHLPRHFQSHFEKRTSDGDTTEAAPPQTLETIEREAIRRTLALYASDKSGVEKAAKALGIGRATLYRKIKSYELD